MFFKKIRVAEVDLFFPSILVDYQFFFDPVSKRVSLQAPEVAVSDNPIAVLTEQLLKPTRTVVLRPEVSMWVSEDPCCLAVVKKVSIALQKDCTQHIQLSVENVQEPAYWPIESFDQLPGSLRAEEPIRCPAQQSLPVSSLREPSVRSQLFGLTAKVRSNPTLKKLPLLKRAIPLHRFSVEKRRQFSEALARQANVDLAKVQLKIVYSPLSQLDFDSIKQTRLGLLCTPKDVMPVSKMPDRRQRNLQVQNDQLFYVVIGLQLDSREDIMARVEYDYQEPVTGLV